MTAFPGNIQIAPRRRFEAQQTIDAAPPRVFKLLCPEMEAHWFPGWTYTMIHSASGFAEAGAVFATGTPGALTYWVVCEHLPNRRVAFTRFQPEGLLVHLGIDLSPMAGDQTAVCIVYTYTALDERGAAALAELSDADWRKMIGAWELSMNRWLEEHPQWPDR